MATTETKKKAPAAAKAPRAKKVKEEKPEVAAEAVAEEVVVKGAYIYAIGRRKTSIARVKLVKNGKGQFTVNGRAVENYFTTFENLNTVKNPLKTAGQETALDVVAEVQGGGMRGQADAVKLGIARGLTELNQTYRKTLKKMGFLTRDPRAKERKKFGLRKARRAPQWSKR